MTEQIPLASALPSTRTLLRSTALAAAVATALLVTVVLPAEYGIDPTGIGGVLGLTEMGTTKLALEKEEATAEQHRTDHDVTITLKTEGDYQEIVELK